MERVVIYIDGPNLLGAISETLERRVWADPFRLSQEIIDSAAQRIEKIYYSETPYPEHVFNPETFRRQQSFFGHLHKYTEAKQVIHVRGSYRINTERVPAPIVSNLKVEIRGIVGALTWRKPTEKGGDVGLAVRLVRGAFENEYDHAIAVTEDIDFAMAIRTAIQHGKKVSISYINNTRRNARALRNLCPQAGFIQITRKELERCEVK